MGIVSKLYSGGGDGMDHSSVRASQGSFPAGSPLLQPLTMLYTNSSIETASIAAPMDDTPFQNDQPISSP